MRNPAPEIFLWSRAAIWLAALFSWLAFEPNRHPRADQWDGPWMHDSGWVFDVWGRWDSVWIVRIAESWVPQDRVGCYVRDNARWTALIQVIADAGAGVVAR